MSKPSQALYEKIYQYYKERILTGQLEPDSRLPTEIQLMERFSVSRITVKRALDDLEKDGYIRRRRGSGSYVNGIQEHLAVGKRIRQIAFVVPDSTSEGPFFTIMKGATDFLGQHHYQLTLYNSNKTEAQEQRMLLQAREEGCDGIIYYPGPVETGQEILFRMAAGRYPIVMLDKVMNSLPITCVVSDNVSGSVALTRYLLEKGHRKIAFVADDPELNNTTAERYLGCCRAIMNAGMPEDSMVHQGVFEGKQDMLEHIHRYNAEATERLTEIIPQLRQKKVTAICALNDNMAMRIYQAMDRLGLSIPEDMAVAGFDDLDYASLASPTLTTVRQDFYTLGYEAAKAVYNQIRQPELPPVRRVIPTQLVVRSST